MKKTSKTAQTSVIVEASKAAADKLMSDRMTELYGEWKAAKIRFMAVDGDAKTISPCHKAPSGLVSGMMLDKDAMATVRALIDKGFKVQATPPPPAKAERKHNPKRTEWTAHVIGRVPFSCDPETSMQDRITQIMRLIAVEPERYIYITPSGIISNRKMHDDLRKCYAAGDGVPTDASIRAQVIKARKSGKSE